MVSYVVNASLGENGSITGGQPGDQTGNEVRVQAWYNRPWDLMLRYPDANKAAQAAAIAARLANSNLVGYNQAQRMTLYRALKAHNWDVDAYIASGELTNVDCSSFVFTCWAAVLPAIRYDGDAPSTSEMRNAFIGWGFTAYTAAKYLTGPDYLLSGDLLVLEGHHTVIAYEPSSDPGEMIIKKDVTARVGADGFKKALAGKYKAVTALNLRNGPGLTYKVLAVIPENATCRNYGYYTDKGSRRWLYVECRLDGVLYTGHASAAYLKKL